MVRPYPHWDIFITLGGYGPNVYIKMGIDTFNFTLTKQGIKPYGDNEYLFETFCNKNGKNAPEDKQGRGCTAWIIANDNMDYLHCPDELDFNGKTKCK